MLGKRKAGLCVEWKLWRIQMICIIEFKIIKCIGLRQEVIANKKKSIRYSLKT